MNTRTKTLTATFAVMALCLCGVLAAQSNDAATDPTYGDINEISVAPDFRWTYTMSFPADLEVTASIEKQGTNTGSSSSTITAVAQPWAVLDGFTVTITVPSNATSGQHYDVILKAVAGDGDTEQVAYQYIRINVAQGLTITTANAANAVNALNDILTSATNKVISLSATSDMGTVSWAVKSGSSLPGWLQLSGNATSGYTLTQKRALTSSDAGDVSFTLRATAKGESKDLTISFKVWNTAVASANETIVSWGQNVSSAINTQTVTNTSSSVYFAMKWAVTSGTLPTGFTLDADTGVVSGKSTEFKDTTVTITGTAQAGPSGNTVTKTITIKTEPVASINDIPDVKRVTTSATSTVTPAGNTSSLHTITWSLQTATTGISINSSTGVVSITSSKTATDGYVDVTLKGTTAIGQTFTKTFRLLVENPFSLGEDDTLQLVKNRQGTYTIEYTGGYNVQLSSSSPAAKYGVVTNSISGSTLSLKSNVASATQVDSQALGTFTITITGTTEAGQTDTKDIVVTVKNVLVFDSTPTVGVIAYAL